MSGRCDRCGRLLSFGDTCTVTEKHIAGSVGQAYMLCKDCLAIVDAAIRMAVNVAKGNRRWEDDDTLRDYHASQIAAEAERRLKAVGETNYERLFGTPEKAARTLTHNAPSTCDECVLVDICEIGMPVKCMIDDCDALLKWLRGDAE